MAGDQLRGYLNKRLQQGGKPDEIKEEAIASLNQSLPTESGQERVLRSQATKFSLYKLTIVFLIAAGLLLVGTVYAYRYFFRSPEWTIAQAIEKMAEVKSLECNLQFKIGVKTGRPAVDLYTQLLPASLSSVSFRLNSKIDRSQADGSRSSGLLSIKYAGNEISVDLRTIGKTFYFRLNQAPNLDVVDLEGLGNQWVKINRDSLVGLVEQDYQEVLKRQDETAAEVKEVIRDKLAEVVKVVEELPDEAVDGVPTDHYRVAVNETGLIQLYLELITVLNEGLASSDQQYLGMNKDDFQRFLKEIDHLKGEVWIGKKDFLPRKAVFRWQLGKDDATIIATIFLRNFNQPMSIAAPTAAVPLDELMGLGLKVNQLSDPLNLGGLETKLDLDIDGNGKLTPAQ